MLDPNNIDAINKFVTRASKHHTALIEALERCVRIFYSDAPKGSKPIPFTYELEQLLDKAKE